MRRMRNPTEKNEIAQIGVSSPKLPSLNQISYAGLRSGRIHHRVALTAIYHTDILRD